MLLDDKYQIDGIVGQGGMGTVYEATHVKLGRKVAIKTMHPRYVTEESVVKRFFREAQLAASLGHDNICEVTDIGTTTDGLHYLVMPLLSGSSFDDVIRKQPALPLSQIGDIVCQILSALNVAHREQIVHRDLKPENVFITKVGDRNNFVKLLDFGISKIMGQSAATELTKTGTVLGTCHYMAPEQARGAKDLDHRVDIYAVGVILYKALTGTVPFEGDSYNEIMYKILVESFATPRSINPAIPNPVEQVVLKAMAREPEARYQSASEMRNALKQAVAGTGGGTAETVIAPTEVKDDENSWTFSSPERNPAPSPWAFEADKQLTFASRERQRRQKRVTGLVAVALLVIAAALAGMYFYVKTAEDKVPSPTKLKELRARTNPEESTAPNPGDPSPPVKEASPGPVGTSSAEPAAKPDLPATEPEKSVEKPKAPTPTAKTPPVRRKKKHTTKPIPPDETEESTESDEEPEQFRLKFVPSQ
jgi:serine/threonine protein kinase